MLSNRLPRKIGLGKQTGDVEFVDLVRFLTNRESFCCVLQSPRLLGAYFEKLLV